MSNYNPGAKAGFTRSGKSLKSVRRYYALLNQQKVRAQDDDKLSKRIALELKTQQDANEKRSRREVVQPLMADSEIPTERSEMPNLMVSPKVTGPVFIAQPTQLPPPLSQSPPQSPTMQADPASGQQYKSIKSLKSTPRSAAGPQGMASRFCGDRCLFFFLGLIIGIAIGVICYLLANKMTNHDGGNVTTMPTSPPNRNPFRPG